MQLFEECFDEWFELYDVVVVDVEYLEHGGI